MHPRNRYKHSKPDFGELGEFYPSLKPHLIQRTHSRGIGKHPPSFPCTLDFSNPEALRALTCAILARDFGIKLEVPLDKLIPAVPQRLNYIHWIEDLLSDADGGAHPEGDGVTGIDIGTGASCIYPLLGTKLNGWRFLATEVNQVAVSCAQGNVTRNGLDDKITVKQVPEAVILIGAIDPSQRYSFCMCNPPFFKDRVEKDIGQSRSGHRPPPSTVGTGSEGETVVEGGEVGFVRRMVDDSLKLRDAVRWYSSMLGKKTSLAVIQDELRNHQVPVVTTAEFVQGKTWRWAIAWSFDERLKTKIAQLPRKRQRAITMRASLAQQPVAGPKEFPSVIEWLREQLTELQMEHTVVHQSETSVTVSCRAQRNTWSNQRRKRRLMEKLSHEQRQKKTAMAGGGEPMQVNVSDHPRNLESTNHGSEEFNSSTSTQMSLCTAAGQQEASASADTTVDRPAQCVKLVSSCTLAGQQGARKPKDLCGEASTVQDTEYQGDMLESEVIAAIPVCSKLTSPEQPVEVKPLTEIKRFEEASIRNGSLTAGASMPAGKEPESLKAHNKSPQQSTSTRDDTEGLAAHVKQELEALCTPCYVAFECTATLESCETTRAKKANDKKDGEQNQGVLLSFEWLQGDDKDSLHQITQYLRNKMQQDRLI